MGAVGSIGMQTPAPLVVGALSCMPQTYAAQCPPGTVSSTSTPNCLSPNCPSLEERNLHPREKYAIEYGFLSTINVIKGWFWNDFHKTQEWLRFRKDDSRDKLLYVTAVSDHNGALAPQYIYEFMNDLNKDFDIKYKVITSFSSICEEIRSATETGKLAHVIINAHGSPDGIVISDGSHDTIHQITRATSTIYSNCFSGLAPNGKIILLSCSTGKPWNRDAYDHYAQKLATSTRRTVIGAIDLLYASKVKVFKKNPHTRLRVSHENGTTLNLLKEFSPDFSCYDLTNQPLHP